MSTKGLKFDIGQTADEYVAPEIDPDDIWIKGFKEGETKIHFVHPITKAITYREHYDGSVRKFVPCLENNECKACQSGNERTRKRSRKYAFQALNGQGQLGVYKIGKKFYDRLVRVEQRGKLLDYDYVIIRVGKSMDDTDYDAEIHDKNVIDLSDLELFNVKKVLGDHYLQYLEALVGDEDEPETEATGASVTKIGSKAKAKDVEVGDEAQSKGWPEATFTTEAGDATPGAQEAAKQAEHDAEPVEDWPLSRLKAYCDEYGIDIPLKASRTTLIPLVEEHKAS